MLYDGNRAKEWCVKKLGGKCRDCGIKSKNYEIYDFHHIKGKIKRTNDGLAIKWFKRRRIPRTVVLLCANCHRIETKRLNRLKNEIFHAKMEKLHKRKVFPKVFQWKYG